MLKYFCKASSSILLLSVALALVSSSVLPSAVVALSGSQFQAGRIIDDAVFFSPHGMSTADIQSFLNAKVTTCDTNGQQIHSSGSTRAVYGASRGYPAPYTCLKDYRQDTPDRSVESGLCNGFSAGNKSAAQIIFEVSHSCGVNPKALIVLLQKEQSLVTDDWPWSIQYRSATGYGCPDTAPCDAEYYGFFNQVYSAARQFKRYIRDAHLFSYRSGRDNYVQYNPNAGCGGTNVYIQNNATAALYNYTPYQPNASALNNLYGSGDSCGAYGNRNFWRMFNDWFGSTTGPDYAWSIESFTYSGGDNIITKDTTEVITLRAKNIGRNTWYNHGNNPIRLGTWEPPDHASVLLSGGIRYATLSESVVAPGEVGTFSTTINPSKSGTFVEAMNLVAENYQWMPWTGFSPTTVVTETPYQYHIENIVYSNGSGVMEPGIPQDMTIIVRNTGNITWSKSSGPPIWLATWTPGRNSAVAYPESGKWPSATRVTEMNEASVAPGETAGFQFKVNVPSSGLFYEKISLVAEGHSWFLGTVPTLWLSGESYAWQPLWVSHSTGTANIPRGQSFRLTLKAKNTGGATWRQNMKLATVAPMDRSSAIYSDFWLSSSRAASLQESSVAPGGTGTFTFITNSPAIPGPYNERLSLVAEGQAWLNDPGFSVYVNSQ